MVSNYALATCRRCMFCNKKDFRCDFELKFSIEEIMEIGIPFSCVLVQYQFEFDKLIIEQNNK